jgi:Uma2 family endonuclease
MADVTQTRMKAQEFLALPESNLPTELIDSEVIMSPAPRDTHQKIIGLLYQQLLKLAEGGELRFSPNDVVLDDQNVVQPDLFWVSGQESACQLNEQDYWEGAPDLVVEVVSPGTARYDKVDKLRLYEKRGVREYWVVEPHEQYVEVYQAGKTGFNLQGTYGPDESFTSTILGGKVVDLKPVFNR